jgi:hypothetical protein
VTNSPAVKVVGMLTIRASVPSPFIAASVTL